MRLVNVRPDGKKRVGSAPHADTIGFNKTSASRVNSAMTSDASRQGTDAPKIGWSLITMKDERLICQGFTFIEGPRWHQPIWSAQDHRRRLNDVDAVLSSGACRDNT